MDWSMYVGRIVKFDIKNSTLYFKGKVTDFDGEMISLIDINDKLVSRNVNEILNIREVGA